MSTSTFASVIVPASSQADAQAALGEGFFVAPLSSDGSLPATHYVSSGWFLDSELELICNEASWEKVVKFGDVAAALASLSLTGVTEEQGEGNGGS
jgi:hypothetical protein